MQELTKSNKLFFRRYEKDEVFNIETYQSTELFNIFTCRIKVKTINNDLLKSSQNENQKSKEFEENLKDQKENFQDEKEIKLFLIYYKKLTFSPKLIEDVFEKSYFLKLKSEFVLEKIGYVINFEAHTIGFLYEYFEGKILSFDDISNIGKIDKDNKLSCLGTKLNFLTRILHIVKKLLNIEVSIGYINPNNFICNMESGGIIKIVEPFILNFCNLNDLYTKCLFGFFKDDYSIPNDKLMLVIFLIYSVCYDENKKQISYPNFLINIYKIINLKNYESPIDKFIEENSTENFYKLISKHIGSNSIELDLNNNTNINYNEFLVTGNKSKYFNQVNRLNMLNDEIMSFLSSIISKQKCYNNKCAEMSYNIHPISHLYLCKNHFDTYSDEITSFKSVIDLTYSIDIQQLDFKDITLDIQTTEDFNKIYLKNEQTKEFIEKTNEFLIKDSHLRFQIFQGQSMVNDIFSYHRSNIKKFLVYEFNNFLSQLENYKQNLVSEEIMNSSLDKINQYVLISKNFIEEMNSENSFYESLQSIRLNYENYNYELSFLKKELINQIFSNFNTDINKIFDDKIISSTFMRKYNIPQIIEKENQYLTFVNFKKSNTLEIVTNKKMSKKISSNSIKKTELIPENSLFKMPNDSQIEGGISSIEIFDSYDYNISNDIIYYEKIFNEENFKKKEIFDLKDLTGSLNNEKNIIKEILSEKSTIISDLSNENLILLLLQSSLNGAFLYDINLNKNFQLSDMLFNHEYPTCCYNNYKVYVIGGNTKKCEVFNILSNSWKALPEIPILFKKSIACFDSQNNLYVVGGECELNSIKENDQENQDENIDHYNEIDDIQRQPKLKKNSMLVLNLNNEKLKWEIVSFKTELQDRNVNFFNYSYLGLVNNSITSEFNNSSSNENDQNNDSIYLIGGESNLKHEYSDCIIKVNLYLRQITKLNIILSKKYKFVSPKFKHKDGKYFNLGIYKNDLDEDVKEIVYLDKL